MESGFIKYPNRLDHNIVNIVNNSECCARLISHVIDCSLHFVITQTGIAALGRHRIKTFERVFVQGFLTFCDTWCPIVFFTHYRCPGNGTAMTHFTAGLKYFLTIDSNGSFCFCFRFSFRRGGFRLLLRFGFS